MRLAIAASLALLLAGPSVPNVRVFRGRNGSVSGAHLIYVDENGRVVHRRLDREQVTTLSDETADARGENGPVIRELPDGTLLAVWAVARGGSGHHVQSELRAQRSRDGGRTWSAPLRLHDEAHRSHNFADVAVARGGDAVVSWIDNRAGQQGVQTAVLRGGEPTPVRTLDPKSCQCCRTAMLAASDGTIWLAWRDLAEGKVRNIAYAVSRDRGKTFEAKGDVADDGWAVDGCPESGPRFAETSGGRVWLAWLNGGKQSIEIASAPRGGAFGAPTLLVTGAVNHPEMGTLPDGRLAVFYEIARGDAWAVEARVRGANGRWSDAIPIAENGRVPRYSRPYLAYTTYIDGEPHVAVVEPRLR